MRKLKFSLNNPLGVSETGFLILNLGIIAKIVAETRFLGFFAVIEAIVNQSLQ